MPDFKPTTMRIEPRKLFKDIPTDNPILVAVSGGSDSLALLLLANVWAQKRGAELQAITIDHGLRPEAAAEASFVASVCAGLDIDHVTLAWEGIKPSFGIQEAARHSRYTLMENFAHEIGADVILTGHTEDDQAETVLMRSFRKGADGDGRGLSGMSRTTCLYGGKQIIRPLLNCTRAQLRSYLSVMAQSWIEDPSNHDKSYERVRVRKVLENDPALARRTLRFGAICARFRKAQAASVAEVLDKHCTIMAGPVIEFRTQGLVHDENPLLAQCLQVLIAMAGGQLHLVSRRRLEPVLSLARGRAAAGDPKKLANRLTIGGAVIERRQDTLLFYRESRNLSPLLLEPGESAIWDGRMHIHNGTHMQVFVEPAGRRHIREFEEARGEPYDVIRRAALWSTPLVHVQTGEGETTPLLPMVESAPVPAGLELRPACPAIEHFCPQWDLPLRSWIRRFDRHTAARIQP